MVTKITFFYNPVASYILFVNVLDVLGFLENISEKSLPISGVLDVHVYQRGY